MVETLNDLEMQNDVIGDIRKELDDLVDEVEYPNQDEKEKKIRYEWDTKEGRKRNWKDYDENWKVVAEYRNGEKFSYYGISAVKKSPKPETWHIVLVPVKNRPMPELENMNDLKDIDINSLLKFNKRGKSTRREYKDSKWEYIIAGWRKIYKLWENTDWILYNIDWKKDNSRLIIGEFKNGHFDWMSIIYYPDWSKYEWELKDGKMWNWEMHDKYWRLVATYNNWVIGLPVKRL